MMLIDKFTLCGCASAGPITIYCLAHAVQSLKFESWELAASPDWIADPDEWYEREVARMKERAPA